MTGRVLVSGGGPVGMALACELLRRDVPVRLVDAADAPGAAPVSRAVLLWPRTLEILHGIGAAEPLLEAGHRLGSIAYRSNGHVLGRVRLDRVAGVRYPFAVTLPQYETERILRERLIAHGGQIERGTAVEDVAAGGAGAEVLLRRADGTSEQAAVGWLVAADGAHSTVRKALGVSFEGDSADVTFAIADAPVAGPVARDTLHYCYTADGALGIVPLPDEMFRIAVSIPHRDPADPPQFPVFERALARRAPGFGSLGEPRWTGSFRVRCRIARSFRQGRAFLAGDAAHVISPAGGQGMNLGLHDAADLGPRLAGVIRRSHSADTLNGYHAVRHAAAQRVSAATAAQTRWGMIQGRTGMAARDSLVRIAAVTGLLQKAAGPVMASTGSTVIRHRETTKREAHDAHDYSGG